MTVAHDNATESATFTTTSPHTFSHTPTGTPQGVLVLIDHGDVSTDLINGTVSYGGVTMTRLGTAADTATEPGRVYAYFLGSSVPTGTQTVSISHTGSSDIKHAVAITVTAAGTGTQVVVTPGTLSANQADPQIAQDSGAASSLRYCNIYSGVNAVASLTLLASHTAIHDHDYGLFVSRQDRQTTASTGSFTVGYTAGSDDVAMIAVAIEEAATATGIPSLPALTASGTAAQTQTSTGTTTLPALTASGTATHGSSFDATGSPSLPALSMASGLTTNRSADFFAAHVDFGDLSSVPDSDVDFTIEAWVKLDTNTGWMSCFGKGSANGWYVSNGNAGTQWRLYSDDGTGGTALTGQTIATGTWQYIAFVHTASANTVQAYYGTIAGGLSTGTLTTSFAGPTTGTDGVRLGSDGWGSGMDGKLRLARVWDKALSSGEVSSVWDRSLPAGYDANLTFNWDGGRDPSGGITASDFKDIAGNNLASSVDDVTLARSTDDPVLTATGGGGSALVSQSATGTATLPALTATGTGNMLPSGTGTSTLPQLAASGTAAQTQTSTGAATLPALTASGTAEQTQSASGTPSLPGLTASGTATHTGSLSADIDVTLKQGGATIKSWSNQNLPSSTTDLILSLSEAELASITWPASNLTLEINGDLTSATAQIFEVILNIPAVSGTPTATGAPSLSSLTATGTATQTQTATGTATLPALTATGTGDMLPSGTGTATLPQLAASGTAEQTQTSTGAATLPQLTATGTAIFGDTATATGTATLPALTASGTAAADYVATGAVTLAALAATGTATQTQTSTGTATLPQLTATGTAAQTQTSTGTATLPQLTATGTAVFGDTVTGSGTVTLPALTASATGYMLPAGVGATTLPALTASGTAVQTQTATGAATLSALTATGTATTTYGATGSPTLPQLTATGTAAQTQTSTGAVTLPQLTAYGQATGTASLVVIAIRGSSRSIVDVLGASNANIAIRGSSRSIVDVLGASNANIGMLGSSNDDIGVRGEQL